MPINLLFAEYKFVFKAIDEIDIPAFSGTLWHSVFGKALKNNTCIAPESECNACLFYRQCDYPFIFRGLADNPPKQQTPVSPHVFKSSSTETMHIPKDGSFSICLLLMGSANERLASVIQAMYQLGKNGFGGKRDKAELQMVTRKHPDGYEQNLLSNSGLQLKDVLLIQPIPDSPKKVSIHFVTPFRFSGKAADTSQFLVSFFLMMLIRRISSLQYYYTGEELRADFSALKKQTESVAVENKKMQQVFYKSLGKRNCMHQQNKGWIGSIELDLTHHHDLWPFLFIGQWVNVGKNANMGFGCYKLVI